jgi:hypothetical protein
MILLKYILVIVLCLSACVNTMADKLHKKKIKNTSASIGLITRLDTLHGMQLNLITSVSSMAKGVQLAGISNMAGGLRGIQIAIFSNISLSPVSGVQLSPVANISRGIKNGTQISGLVNVCSGNMHGYQQSAYNYTDTLNGVQFGAINVCVNHKHGMQIGFINCSRDTVANKIGLVNVNPNTKIDILTFAGTSCKFNFALRFRNKSTYSIIGMGTSYMGLNKRFSGAIYYRLGQYFDLTPKWSVSSDLGFFHIETFQRNSDIAPDRLYSLQLRVNVDYRVNNMLGLFASLGYGDTRYYSHSKEYRNRALLELGTSFRLRIKNEQ